MTAPGPRLRPLVRLLSPGVGVKRWMGVAGAGLFLVSLGVAYGLRELFRESLPWIFGPPGVVAIGVVGVGGGLVVLGTWRLYGVLAPALSRRRQTDVMTAIYEHRRLERGPRVVAIGGGTGLSTLLRGVKRYTDNVCAVVTVADDGGSSGRLRRDRGVPPPGDLRNCLVALSDAEPLLGRLFQYRFDWGEGLSGHSFGNLFLVALASVAGDFRSALEQASRTLAVRGRIVPSTPESVSLTAEMEDGTRVRGESSIARPGGRIRRVALDPLQPVASPAAVQAILRADMVVLGPGSLYTSVLPNLLVPGIRQALEASAAPKVFVCNVATQEGETDGYGVEDHLAVVDSALGPGLIDAVIANSNVEPVLSSAETTQPVPHRATRIDGVPVVAADLVDPEFPHHHQPDLLAAALEGLWRRNGSGLTRGSGA